MLSRVRALACQLLVPKLPTVSHGYERPCTTAHAARAAARWSFPAEVVEIAMNRRLLSALGVLASCVALTACEASKSSTPLSPAVAGPIPGVEISAPKMLEPGPNAKIANDQQPVTLLIENASTTGVRPLRYVFEIAVDANFNSTVFSREGVT